MNKEAWDLEEEAEFMYGPGCWMVGARRGGGPIKVPCKNCGATHTELDNEQLCVLKEDCALRKEMKARER